MQRIVRTCEQLGRDGLKSSKVLKEKSFFKTSSEVLHLFSTSHSNILNLYYKVKHVFFRIKNDLGPLYSYTNDMSLQLYSLVAILIDKLDCRYC